GIQGYGANPPSIGIDFFEGPFADPNDGVDNDRDCTVDEFVAGGCDPEPRTERIIMAKFLYFNNDGQPNGNPTTAENAYNYMIGRWRDNTKMVYGGNGYPGSGGAVPSINSGLMFPGATDRQYGWGVGGSCQNPIATPFDWSEFAPGPGANPNVPADRRFVQSAGPFTLQPGAVNYVTIGVVWARASSGGARGSFNLLLKADSKSQALFDNCFKTIDGPDAPDVDITELDQELILTFSYLPTSNNYRLGYRELDPVIKALNENRPPGTAAYDSVYRFEGFKVYQLSASNVSTGELEDQSKARLVYQGDVQNGVDRIINWEFDPDLEQSVPYLAVSGANKGVNMTLKLTRDAFAEGSDQLVNFKKYYYTVIAYGYNLYARYDIVTDTGQQKPYLPGRNNVRTYTGIPHKTAPIFDGLVLNSAYGDQPQVRRMEGTGNGGNLIEIDSLDVIRILENGFVPTPLYKKNAAPISIKVIDPTAVPDQDLRLFVYNGSPGSAASVTDTSRWYA
ncbi:MAG: T9SS C-terminal target domain-containing protein, partial [Bacteroidota bacterium]